MKHIQFLMKDKWLFLFFLIWFGGMFWIVSERFVDAETDPKAYFALFGAVIFCMFWVLKTFRWDMSSKFCFTDFAAAIMLCAVSQAFYAILQKTGVCTSFGAFPVCGSFDNPAGVASALAFSLPFCLGLVDHRYSCVRKVAWASIAIIAMGVIVSESRSGILATYMVIFVFFVIRRKCIRKLWMIFPVVGLVAAVVYTIISKIRQMAGC